MRCIFIKPNKKRCEANAMAECKHCFYHNPAISAEEKLEAQIRGGKANKIAIQAPLPAVSVKRTTDVVLLLDDTISRVRSGELDLRIANTIGYLSGHLIKALEVSDLEARLEELEK